jgi:hypothetical protein
MARNFDQIREDRQAAIREGRDLAFVLEGRDWHIQAEPPMTALDNLNILNEGSGTRLTREQMDALPDDERRQKLGEQAEAEARAMGAILSSVAGILEPDEQDDFRGVVLAPGSRVTLQDLFELLDWMVSTTTGRPTSPLAHSPSPPRAEESDGLSRVDAPSPVPASGTWG